jgi:hypothetical protein
MVIFQINMSELYCQIIVRIIISIILLAVIIYFNFIFFKPRELPGLFVLLKIIPTVILSIGLIYFSSSSFTAIQTVSLLNSGKYFSVQGNIEDLVIDEFWLNGSDVPNYDCSFVVNGVEFPFSNYYTTEEANALKSANEEGDIVKVSYLLDPKSKSPHPFKIETLGEQ